MLRKIHIQNYKSVLNHTIELGRLNVFIGENGCGKTNVLEAVAMASAALADKLDTEELYAKGIRVAKPSITFSSFLNTKQVHKVALDCTFDPPKPFSELATFRLVVNDADDIVGRWSNEAQQASFTPEELFALFLELQKNFDEAQSEVENQSSSTKGWPDAKFKQRVENMKREAERVQAATARHFFHKQLNDFVIYNLNVPALRGVQNISRKMPLGIYGENLDVLISTFGKAERRELLHRAKLISWVENVLVDIGDELKFKGHKLGRSTSTLYFKDRFMQRRNNIFAAENANEGVLHVLFYLTLFISKQTPPIFGIDNIESALNPQLCRELTKELAVLAKANDKQALVTTHNPAILDGLNLHDDEQRLFVVYRNDDGHTVTKRIKVKPDTSAGKYKLSELWMRGHLGGIPKHF
jgi:predicted ATPase